jgi:membrane associated rhomboid family serine protease
MKDMMARVFPLLGLVAVIWVVELANILMEHRLGVYGIVPRTVEGLRGIPLSPFLHGSIQHAVSNTVPLLVLGGLVAIRGRNAFLGVSLFVIVAGGAGVWLVGRTAFHIGASGLVFGYFGYLVARGWYDRSVVSILVALVVVALYWGLLFGVLPTAGFVSWEGHLMGLLAGVLAARLGRRERRQDDQ